jgi:hypothetical protein
VFTFDYHKAVIQNSISTAEFLEGSKRKGPSSRRRYVSGGGVPVCGMGKWRNVVWMLKRK